MENSNWKPIKDYQPPIGHILVTIKWDDDDYEVCELDYWGYYDRECDIYKSMVEKVIAWQELPEPYKED